MIPTRDLAIYAAIVATADFAWTLFQGAVRDRARVKVRVADAQAISPGSNQRQPMLMVSASNRGRRAIYITHVARVASIWRGTHEVSADIMRELVNHVRLEESQSHTFVHGQLGGYASGDMPLTRWYVTDGGGRIHPLRERYRQRVERIVLWPIRSILRWRTSYG